MKSMTLYCAWIGAQFIKRTGCLLWSGWKKDRTTRYIYLKIEMLVSCKQMETQPVIWKVCMQLFMNIISETRDIKPSDRFKNNWWCQFFSLLSQTRVALTKVTIGISINHPNHSLFPGLVLWTTLRKVAGIVEIIKKQEAAKSLYQSNEEFRSVHLSLSYDLQKIRSFVHNVIIRPLWISSQYFELLFLLLKVLGISKKIKKTYCSNHLMNLKYALCITPKQQNFLDLEQLVFPWHHCKIFPMKLIKKKKPNLQVTLLGFTIISISHNLIP